MSPGKTPSPVLLFLVVAAFGWLKAPNTKNTSLVAPAWSPSGLLLTAGSGEEVVKIFDIRCHNTQVPLSVEKPGDRGAVYRVAWAPTRSLLVSTGDKKIRLHGLRGDVLGV
ncbi:U5 small nuclear ribonucleoprotein 40 kDa protein-like protein [Tanacetum coccineum]